MGPCGAFRAIRIECIAQRGKAGRFGSLVSVNRPVVNVLTTLVGLLPAGPFSSRRVVVDLALWAVTAAPFALDLARWELPVVVSGCLLTACVVLACRRVPIAALALAAVTVLIDWRYVVSFALAGFAAGRRMANERVALAVFALVSVGGLVAVFVLGLDPDESVRVGGVVLSGLIPWLIGLYRRQRAALVRGGWERAVQLEEHHRTVADQARLRERARIAHDMHDFLGHHLSLASLHAGALEVAEGMQDEHAQKAGELRTSIAVATEQLREITSVLRDESDPMPFAPAGDSIPALVERSATAGLDVRLEAHTALDELEPMRHRAIYRMVQESLTNVAKHAPGAVVLVRISALPDVLEVSVANGPPAEAVHDQVRGHRGLVGVRERARLLGGTLESGPVDGGFGVTMRVPHDPARPPAEFTAGHQVSGVEHDFRRASSRVQRSLMVAVLGPVVAATLVALILMGFYAYDTFTSVLTPGDYRRAQVGDSRSMLAGVLPERQVPERGEGTPPPKPEGSTCEYYRSTAGFVPSAFDVYRLCFYGGRLADKDVLTR